MINFKSNRAMIFYNFIPLNFIKRYKYFNKKKITLCNLTSDQIKVKEIIKN